MFFLLFYFVVVLIVAAVGGGPPFSLSWLKSSAPDSQPSCLECWLLWTIVVVVSGCCLRFCDALLELAAQHQRKTSTKTAAAAAATAFKTGECYRTELVTRLVTFHYIAIYRSCVCNICKAYSLGLR